MPTCPLFSTRRLKTLQPKKIALLAREAADAKKAEDLVLLDVAKLTSLSHYFLITHGNSERHVKAIANGIIDTLHKKSPLSHIEGMESGQWILLDYGSVIAHIFYHELRPFYNLERLWGDAHRL